MLRARRPSRVPVVFTQEEVAALSSYLSGTYRLTVELLYGSGLRLMEAVRLRVKDPDFAAGVILVRDGKGEKDRRTMLPRPSTSSPRRGSPRTRARASRGGITPRPTAYSAR